MGMVHATSSSDMLSFSSCRTLLNIFRRVWRTASSDVLRHTKSKVATSLDLAACTFLIDMFFTPFTEHCVLIPLISSGISMFAVIRTVA